MPFAVKPLPWVLGALSPVISSRTMMMHHGSHYSQCIESANRLARDHKNLAGKTPLEIVRWAREHARGTELHSTASEAWNHSFYWECLTPQKKRPSGELRTALYRTFGDFSNFADKFALAGATHVGSGWLWLTANSRKQVRILTTSDADCPEARGHTCLLAIDLWEHAYYLDHQNRRREYLDALIDRRLDWVGARLAGENAGTAQVPHLALVMASSPGRMSSAEQPRVGRPRRRSADSRKRGERPLRDSGWSVCGASAGEARTTHPLREPPAGVGGATDLMAQGGVFSRASGGAARGEAAGSQRQ